MEASSADPSRRVITKEERRALFEYFTFRPGVGGVEGGGDGAGGGEVGKAFVAGDGVLRAPGFRTCDCVAAAGAAGGVGEGNQVINTSRRFLHCCSLFIRTILVVC